MHYFKNFKGFRDSKIDLMEPVTLLIGRNGAGKSNVIEGVELLANLVHGRQLHEISDFTGGAEFQIRGGLNRCASFGEDHFTLEFSTPSTNQFFKYSITINTIMSGYVSKESLVFKDKPIFSAIAHEGQRELLDVQYENFKRGRNNQTTFPSSRSIISRYENDIQPNIDQTKPNARITALVVRSLKDYLHSSFVFDPDPKAMREYQGVNQTRLTRNGASLSSVLFNMDRGSEEDIKNLEFIFNQIKQLPEEPYQDFGFITTTPLRDVMFGLQRDQGDVLVDAKVLSDGTLRCLAVLTAVTTAPVKSRVIIEEFDNGLHPSRINMLLNAIWEKAQERELNVLLTTHNPATLNALSMDQVERVVLCVADPGGGSRLVPVDEIPESLHLLQRGALGDLVTRGMVDKYLAPNYIEDKHRKIAEWLETLG